MSEVPLYHFAVAEQLWVPFAADTILVFTGLDLTHRENLASFGNPDSWTPWSCHARV